MVLSAVGKSLTNGKTRLFNLFAATDRTFAGFSQSLPLSKLKAAPFTCGRGYDQAFPAFLGCHPDMLQMVKDLFLRNPYLCGYLPGREDSPYKERNYFPTDGVMLFCGDKRLFRFCFHSRASCILHGTGLTIIYVVDLPWSPGEHIITACKEKIYGREKLYLPGSSEHSAFDH